MTEKDLFWYVAVTYRKEKIIKQELDKMQIEHFIPFREVTKERFGKKITHYRHRLRGARRLARLAVPQGQRVPVPRSLPAG